MPKGNCSECGEYRNLDSLGRCLSCDKIASDAAVERAEQRQADRDRDAEEYATRRMA